MDQIITENILGYDICCLERQECISFIYQLIMSGQKHRYFVCANPHSIEMAETDAVFKQAIQQADLITPDGSGIIFASKLLNGRIRSRVTGSFVFRELSRILNTAGGYRYFFLGSTDENLERIRKKMMADYPDIQIAGMYSPPFRDAFSYAETRDMVRRINAAGTDVLWVGMTAPKQEKWVFHNRNELDVRFIGPVGAVFDFYVGTVRRSPPFFLKHGLEWLPRLIQQPGRLWKRMGVSAPRFVIRLLKQKIKNK